MNRFFFGKRGEIATMITILTIGIVSMLGVLISKVNNSTVSTSSKAQQAYPQCIDTDKGPYFSKAGKVTYKTVDTNGTVQTFEYKDKCVKGNGLPGTGVPAFDTVTEYYCDGTTLKNKELPCRDVARGDSCVTDTETIGYCNGETVPKPTSPMDAPIPTGGFSGEARIDSIRTRYLSKSTATFDVVYCGGNQPWPTIYGETWIDGEMVTTVHRTPVQFNRAGGDEACKKVQVTVDFAKAYQDDPCQDILLVGKGKYDQARNDASFKQVANFPFLVTKNPECILPTATPTQTPTATPMPDATATPVPPAVCTYDADSYICTDLKDGVCDTTKLVKEDGFKNEFLKADGQPNTLTMKDGQTSVHYPTANLTKEYNSYVKLIPPTSDWEITSTYCTKDGTGVCPANAGQPVDKLDSFKVACGAKYNYGWVIKKKSVQTNKTYQLDLYDSTRPDGTDDRTCWAAADTKDGTNNNIRTADFSNYACSGAVDGKVNKLTASYTNKTSGTVKVRWQINSCDGTLGENNNKCEKVVSRASDDFLIDVSAGKKLTCDWKNPNTINRIDKDADCTITDAGSVSPPASTNTPTPTRTPTPTP
ncbi:MAG: hypothetical protein Q7S61_06070, partial [bacterium]|nr:hypothetical protein [bacterium]